MFYVKPRFRRRFAITTSPPETHIGQRVSCGIICRQHSDTGFLHSMSLAARRFAGESRQGLTMSHRHIPTFLLIALLVLLFVAPQPSTETPSPLAGASGALAASSRQATTARTSAGEMFVFLPVISTGHAINTVFLI